MSRMFVIQARKLRTCQLGMLRWSVLRWPISTYLFIYVICRVTTGSWESLKNIFIHFFRTWKVF